MPDPPVVLSTGYGDMDASQTVDAGGFAGSPEPCINLAGLESQRTAVSR